MKNCLDICAIEYSTKNNTRITIYGYYNDKKLLSWIGKNQKVFDVIKKSKVAKQQSIYKMLYKMPYFNDLFIVLNDKGDFIIGQCVGA